MPSKTRARALFGTLAVVALVATGCGGSDGGAAVILPPETRGYDALRGTVHGGGSSFQDTFEQTVSADFAAAVASLDGEVAVTYTKTGSSDGKKSLAEGTVDFAGTDSPIKDDELVLFGGRDVLYFPIMGGPISLAFNIDGVDALDLRPDTVAGIFQARITRWDDPAIQADNPGARLPPTAITVVHRSDGSGTTANFTKFLTKAAPDSWTLGAGEDVAWPPTTQGAEKSTGVTSIIKGTDGAIGYADLADAAKELLDVARVANPDGDFTRPTPDAAAVALGAAEIGDDLTFDPLNVDAEGAYPITSPTWILLDAVQGDRATVATMQAYLRYVLTVGQARAKELLYAPLPRSLAERALAQVDDLVVSTQG